MDDRYYKFEVDHLLDEKADKVNTYTKTQVDNMLEDIASADNVYTKTQVDNLLDEKADADTTYSIVEVNNLLDDKADKSDTYTKNEVNTIVGASEVGVLGIVATNHYTKSATDMLLNGKANTNHTHTIANITGLQQALVMLLLGAVIGHNWVIT